MAIHIEILNREIQFNDLQMSLRYDSIASTFSFSVYYDPTNEKQKQLFRPLSFNSCKIYYKHADNTIETLVTGMLVRHQFKTSEVKQWVVISGYSITGVLENSSIADFPIQFDNLSLKEIAEKICKPFGLSVTVDPTVKDICNQVANIAVADIKQTCKQFLSELCTQKMVVLSHTPYGKVLLTSIKTIKVTTTTTTSATTTGVPVDPAITGKINTELQDNQTKKKTTEYIYNFGNSDSHTLGMELNTNGQDMHSQIIVLGQAGEINSYESVANNPYVVSNIPNNNALNTWKPKILLQTFGTPEDTKICAGFALMQELKDISLSITINTWFLNKKMVKPNQMITVTNSDLGLSKKTRFFIESVTYMANEKSDTAVLTCVLPEAYDHEIPHNVFI